MVLKPEKTAKEVVETQETTPEVKVETVSTEFVAPPEDVLQDVKPVEDEKVIPRKFEELMAEKLKAYIPRASVLMEEATIKARNQEPIVVNGGTVTPAPGNRMPDKELPRNTFKARPDRPVKNV